MPKSFNMPSNLGYNLSRVNDIRISLDEVDRKTAPLKPLNMNKNNRGTRVPKLVKHHSSQTNER